MPPATNPIDLTNLANVKAWLGASGTTDDQTIQDAITAFSAWVLKQTGRGPADGSVPTTSPFVVNTTSYDEVYDGNGNDRLFTYQWPINVVASVTAEGVSVPQSSGVNVRGWVVDQTKKCLVYRSGSPRLVRSAYGPGYGYMNGYGWPLGTQNIEIVYSAGFAAVPFDLEFMCRKVVGATYKRKSFIGQKQQAMAQGAGTVTWVDWLMDKADTDVMRFYQARA